MAGLDLQVPLGLGTMHWGDTPLDKAIAGRVLPDETLTAIRDRALAAGVRFVDTAEGYGGGTSEARIGRLRFPVAGCFVATKFLPTYWRWTARAFERAQSASNRRLRVAACDLTFIHSPVHLRRPDVWIRGAAKAWRAGRLRALGLSNFNADQVRRAVQVAAEEGIPVLANQIQYNLLVASSAALRETVAASHESGLTVLGYGVLGQGLLADGLTLARFDTNVLARRLGLSWEALMPIREVLADIAQKRSRPMSHVCLAWARGHRVVPLVGIRSVAQLEDSLAGLDFSLRSDEIAALDAQALDRSTFDRPRWQRLLTLGFLSLLMAGYKASALARSPRRAS